MTLQFTVANMAKLLPLLAFFFHSTTSHVTFRTCGLTAPCTPLRNCRSLVLLLRQGHQGVIRNALCNSVGPVSYVCCPTTTTMVLPTPRPTPPPSLLPNSCGLPFTQDKIIGGQEATVGAYPWMAAFGYIFPTGEIKFQCAGSVISKRYILTAAHCLDAKVLGIRKLEIIHLGDHDLSQNGRDCQRTRAGNRCAEPHLVVRPESFIFHPMYNKRARSSDDIALIRIDRDLDFEGGASIQPICLPNSTLEVKSFVGNRMPVAAGWGHTETAETSNILLSAYLPVAENSLCEKKHNPRFVSKQLCIGGQDGVDTCSGDSGGPLVVSGPTSPPYIQIGIVSYGPFPCAIPGTPGVYTDVSKYVDWIESKLRS